MVKSFLWICWTVYAFFKIFILVIIVLLSFQHFQKINVNFNLWNKSQIFNFYFKEEWRMFFNEFLF